MSNESKGRLYFTVGLPRSGKSTYCNEWVKGERIVNPDSNAVFAYWYQSGRPRAIVGGDDFRRALHGGEFRIESEGTVFAMMDVAARALLNRGIDVIIDETCTTYETLLRYIKLDINAQAVFIDTPADVCVERAKADGREYLIGPIGRMAAQLEDFRSRWPILLATAKKYVLSRRSHDVAA